MNVLSIFKKIGKVFKKIGRGSVTVGEKVVDIADIPMIKELVVIVPVIGPAIAIALRYVGEAEEVWSDMAKAGDMKRGYALILIEEALKEANLDSTRARGLLELAWLIQENAALIKRAKDILKDKVL